MLIYRIWFCWLICFQTVCWTTSQNLRQITFNFHEIVFISNNYLSKFILCTWNRITQVKTCECGLKLQIKIWKKNAQIQTSDGTHAFFCVIYDAVRGCISKFNSNNTQTVTAINQKSGETASCGELLLGQKRANIYAKNVSGMTNLGSEVFLVVRKVPVVWNMWEWVCCRWGVQIMTRCALFFLLIFPGSNYCFGRFSYTVNVQKSFYLLVKVIYTL